MKHGHSPRLGKSKTYQVWRSMMQRCYRPKDKSYPWYGAKGIVVCDRWKEYRNFLEDMGEVPIWLTLDRVDSSANYSKENCRWSTRTEQTRNRSNTVMVEFRGDNRPLAEWSEISGINFNKLRRRMELGWPIERALQEWAQQR